MPRTLEMMAENVGTAIDAQCFDALQAALRQLDSRAAFLNARAA